MFLKMIAKMKSLINKMYRLKDRLKLPFHSQMRPDYYRYINFFFKLLKIKMIFFFTKAMSKFDNMLSDDELK